MRKILYWGPTPDELDGGAVVADYLWRKYYEMFPLDELYAVPKNVEELNPQRLPFVTFLKGDKHGLYREGGKLAGMAEHMTRHNIPLLVAFHIAESIGPHVFPIHEVGGVSILYQTIHWANDQVFTCKELPHINWFVTPTDYAKEVLCRVGKIPTKRVSVIPHGVDVDKFYPHNGMLRNEFGIKDDQPVILYCGRLDLWKGIHNVIPSIRPLVQDYNAVFIIRGGVRQLEKSREMDYLFTTLANKYKRNVIYIPQWMPPEYMEELMASCDIYLSNSGHEGFNVPLVESMACGRPVLTTDLANHREIVGGTRNELHLLTPTEQVGIVNETQPVKVASAQLIYGALRQLLDNPEEREVCGMQGREKVLQQYDLRKVCSDWHKLFYTLIPDDYDLHAVMSQRMLNQ